MSLGKGVFPTWAYLVKYDRTAETQKMLAEWDSSSVGAVASQGQVAQRKDGREMPD